jgi:hypothetical protein
MSTTIDARNLRTTLNGRLQEAQLKLLNAGVPSTNPICSLLL